MGIYIKMPFFTWKRQEGRTAVARDETNQRTLFLDQGDVGDANMDFTDFDIHQMEHGKRNGRSQKRMDLLRKHLIKHIEPLDDEIAQLYKVAHSKKDKEISLKDGTFEPMPSGKGREVVYITAPSGAGKSYWISQYTKNYERMYPDNKIILVSRLGDDEVLDKIKGLTRLELDESIVEQPIDCQTELQNTLIIYDDVDTIQEKKLKSALMQLQDDILQVGRHSNTSILISSHLSTNYKDTRIVLAESHKVVCFPRASSAHSLKYLLGKYVGFDKEYVQKVMKLPSRWACIQKQFPQYILGQHNAFLVS